VNPVLVMSSLARVYKGMLTTYPIVEPLLVSLSDINILQLTEKLLTFLHML